MEVDTATVQTNRLAKNARLEARVTIEQKQLLERAASLRGQNLTEFMISVLADAATQTILDSELIALTDRDRQAFAAALLNPTAPSAQANAKRATKAVADAQWYTQFN
jgi:uncharacterized protein (DUF1778 family)